MMYHRSSHLRPRRVRSQATLDRKLHLERLEDRVVLSSFQSFLLSTGTALHETSSAWDFAVTDWNADGSADLLSVVRSGTGSGSTEIHILNGADGFQSFLLSTGTALHETSSAWDFAVTDWNGDGWTDLLSVARSGTGSGSTEVHILNGADGFQSFLLSTGTGLHETSSTWDFAVTDWNSDGRPDLLGVVRSGTGSGSTEVHILNGADGFRSFLLSTGTALHETSSTWDFAVTDWNGDGWTDLLSVVRSATGSGSTEVHILNGADGSGPMPGEQGGPIILPDVIATDPVDLNGTRLRGVFTLDIRLGMAGMTILDTTPAVDGAFEFLSSDTLREGLFPVLDLPDLSGEALGRTLAGMTFLF